jgi:TP901 family phage tail tape measure protein
MASKYSIEAAFKLVDQITAPLNKIGRELDKLGIKSKTVSTVLKSGFDKASDRLDKFGKKIKKTMGYMTAAGAAATVAFVVKGVKDFMEFQTALARIKTLDVSAPLANMSKEITSLSNIMGIAATEISSAVELAMSSGVETSKAVSFAEVAAKAAVGGFTDTATAVSGLTTILNAYGLSADHAMRISDQMLIAQNLGVTTFGDMAKSIGEVIPSAVALNVKTHELFAGVTALTGIAGYDTPKAMTGLNAALMGLMKPGAQQVKMAKQLGLDFSAAGIQSRGFAQTIKDIYAATGGNQDLIGKLFRSGDALKVINVLGGSGAELFEKSMSEMQRSAGATQTAFEIMMDTPQRRWEKAMNAMKNAGINLGAAFLPVVEKIIEKISGIADSITQIDVTPIVNFVGNAVDTIMRLAGIIGVAVKIVWKFRYAIAAILIPISAVNLAFMIGLGVFGLYNKIVAIAAFYTGIWSFVMKIADKIQKSLIGKAIGHTIALGAQTIATAAMAVATGTATVAQLAFNTALTASPIGPIIVAIAALVGIIVALIAGIIFLIKNWDKVTKAVKRAFVWLGGFFSSLGNSIKKAIEPIIIWFKTVWDDAVSFFKTVWSSVADFFKSVWDGVASFFKTIWDSVSNFFKGIWDAIYEKVASVAKWFNDIWQTVTGAFSAAWIWVSNLFSSIWDGIKEKISSFVDWLKPVIDNIVNAFKPIVDFIGGVIDGISSAFSDATKAGDAALAAYDEANKKTSEAATVVKNADPPTTAIDKAIDEMAREYGLTIDMSDFTTLDGASGKSKLHGVVDISGGALSVPGLTNTPTSTVTDGTVINTPQITEHAALLSILNVVKHIDGGVTEIVKMPAPQITATGGVVVNTPQISESAALLSIFNIIKHIDVNVAEMVRIPRPQSVNTASQAQYDGEAGEVNPRDFAPVTQADRVAYSLREQRETVVIEVAAARGTEARVVRAPRDIDIRLVRSGANSG